MSTRIVGTHVAAVVVLLCGIAAAQIAPVPPGPAAVGLVTPQTGPTDMDQAYHYSTIGQELAYANIRENTARKPDCAAPNPKPQIGGGPRSSPLQAPCTVSPLSSVFYPAISAFCPSPSRLVSRLEAAGYRL